MPDRVFLFKKQGENRGEWSLPDTAQAGVSYRGVKPARLRRSASNYVRNLVQGGVRYL